jgi:AcrR family transcriptional regulator
VYQFFPNVESVKIALIERLLEQYYDHFATLLHAQPKAGNLRQFGLVLVDATHDFYQAHPNIVAHIVASRSTEEFNQVNRHLNHRLEELMMNYFSDNAFGLDQKTSKRKISVAIATGDMMTMFIWSAETQEERDAYLQDWRELVSCYNALP